MRDLSIAGYIRNHLAEVVAVMNVLDLLSQKDSSLELHRFFVRLQTEMGEDPKALQQLLFGLGDPVRENRILSQSMREMARTRLIRSGLDPQNPEIFEALEWLALESQGKALMWKTLSTLSPRVPSWRGVDFKSREQRARNQRDRIESVRLEVASEVLRIE